jgi:DNA-binding response OmpR family regulator
MSEAQPAAGKVLYVDDEEALAGLAVRVLERAGYAAESYTNPAEALAAFSADPGAYALVMTDHNMPGMSGLDLAVKLHEVRSEVPVLLFSGYVNDEIRAQAVVIGIKAILDKPTPMAELVAAVRAHILT